MANKILEYRDGAVTLRGYLADDVRPGARPGVVLFPEAFGIGDHVIERARRLAALGYVALAADPYGDGVQAQDLPRAIELMTAVRSDVSRWRARAQAALDALCTQPSVDRTKLAAIGYCFGRKHGARARAEWRTAERRGELPRGLEAPKPEDARNIRAKVLVCHGASDPLIPPEQVVAFEAQMRDTKVDWQLCSYGGAVHSFTNPDADKLRQPGARVQRGR